MWCESQLIKSISSFPFCSNALISNTISKYSASQNHECWTLTHVSMVEINDLLAQDSLNKFYLHLSLYKTCLNTSFLWPVLFYVRSLFLIIYLLIFKYRARLALALPWSYIRMHQKKVFFWNFYMQIQLNTSYCCIFYNDIQWMKSNLNCPELCALNLQGWLNISRWRQNCRAFKYLFVYIYIKTFIFRASWVFLFNFAIAPFSFAIVLVFPLFTLRLTCSH